MLEPEIFKNICSDQRCPICFIHIYLIILNVSVNQCNFIIATTTTHAADKHYEEISDSCQHIQTSQGRFQIMLFCSVRSICSFSTQGQRSL